MDDLISQQKVLDILRMCYETERIDYTNGNEYINYEQAVHEVEQLSAAQPEKETPRRVRWSGWKGHRLTRYWCPNCDKPVRNDDEYCHRCGQKLIFPKISHTPYVPGEKQETIVRWDDER